jgi:hypothetical protein
MALAFPTLRWDANPIKADAPSPSGQSTIRLRQTPEIYPSIAHRSGNAASSRRAIHD